MLNTAPHRIFIIDSHLPALRALSQFIHSQPDFRVSQMSNDWRTLLTDNSNLPSGVLSPSVVLLDWESPGIGRNTLNTIRSTVTQSSIVAMGVWRASRQSALAAGADGFINKTDAPEQILAVLRRVGNSIHSCEPLTLA